MTMNVPVLLSTLACICIVAPSLAQMSSSVTGNTGVTPEFDFIYSVSSDIWYQTQNTTQYYCIFRSLWNNGRQPNDFPAVAKFSDIVSYTTSSAYRPWMEGQAVSVGVETLVEVRCLCLFLVTFLVHAILGLSNICIADWKYCCLHARIRSAKFAGFELHTS